MCSMVNEVKEKKLAVQCSAEVISPAVNDVTFSALLRRRRVFSCVLFCLIEDFVFVSHAEDNSSK